MERINKGVIVVMGWLVVYTVLLVNVYSQVGQPLPTPDVSYPPEHGTAMPVDTPVQTATTNHSGTAVPIDEEQNGTAVPADPPTPTYIPGVTPRPTVGDTPMIVTATPRVVYRCYVFVIK